MTFLIYGANGYTGRLIAEHAVRRGLAPILAGRNAVAIESLANSLKLSSRIVSVDKPESTLANLQDVRIVLNCAGPFIHTAPPLMQACINAGAHYFDITGEIAVFELAQQFKQRASAAGIVICPGVGFDVIPTDCAALLLKQAMPDAIELALGFEIGNELSPGTAKTAIDGLKNGGQVRRSSAIVKVPYAYAVRSVDFGNGLKTAMSIPWGDISTSFHTTGIPNITTFIATSRRAVWAMKVANLLSPILQSVAVKKILVNQIEKRVKGPARSDLETLRAYIWGEARNNMGKKVSVRFSTPSAYALTVNGALAIVESFLHGRPESGTWTPARLMGSNFVFELPGVSKPQITME